ncbi:MAG: hypothetical protein ISR51_09705 [Rhodospirillales bacterium]|nr:hypothetical protein [Rhodospirillales bacterium]
MKRIILAALVGVLVSGPAWGQGKPPTLRYLCVFQVYASMDGLKEAKDFKLEFILETASGKGMLIGNNGFSKVFVVNGPYAVTFLERLETGVVQSTTITQNGLAVHSRHSVILKELVPSQYYGNCKIKAGKPIFK